jgi:hypothetical protein
VRRPHGTRYRSRPRLTGPPNPFQTVIQFAAALTGAVYLFGLRTPDSLSQTLPRCSLVIWEVLLFAGGVLALLGQYWPGRPFAGVAIKRAGLFAIAGGLLAYALAAWSVFGTRVLWLTIWNVFIAWACLVRVWQVTRILRAARSHAREGSTGG